jgi:hypothetical protein
MADFIVGAIRLLHANMDVFLKFLEAGLQLATIRGV